MYLVSNISGNTYIFAFLHIVVITIPGNFRKDGAPILIKTVNFGGPRKIWNFFEFRGNLEFSRFREISEKSPFLLNSG